MKRLYTFSKPASLCLIHIQLHKSLRFINVEKFKGDRATRFAIFISMCNVGHSLYLEIKFSFITSHCSCNSALATAQLGTLHDNLFNSFYFPFKGLPSSSRSKQYGRLHTKKVDP